MRILRLPEVFFNTQIADLSRVAQEPREREKEEGRKAPKKRLSENENRYFAGAQHFGRIATDKKLPNAGMAIGTHYVQADIEALLKVHQAPIDLALKQMGLSLITFAG